MPSKLPVPASKRNQVLFAYEAVATRIAAPDLQERHGDQPLQTALKLQTEEALLVFYITYLTNVAWQYVLKG
jgi:hypothetical protein